MEIKSFHQVFQMWFKGLPQNVLFPTIAFDYTWLPKYVSFKKLVVPWIISNFKWLKYDDKYSCAYRTNCLIQFCIMHNSCIQCPHCNPPLSFTLLITSLHFILCWKQWWIKCIQCPTPHSNPSCQLHFANKLFHLPLTRPMHVTGHWDYQVIKST